jgi:hypothetical protein
VPDPKAGPAAKTKKDGLRTEAFWTSLSLSSLSLPVFNFDKLIASNIICAEHKLFI